MKLLQVNSVCGIGSTGRIAVDLYNEAKNAGHGAAIAYGREPALACPETIRLGVRPNLLDIAKTRLFDSHGYANRAATKRLTETISREGFTLVHLHNVHGYYLHLPTLFQFLKKSGIPVVWTLHDCWPFTGHCAFYQPAGCQKWLTGCGGCPLKREYPASFLLDASARNYKNKKNLFGGLNCHLVTPSRWLAGEAEKSFLGGYPVSVIPNGIDLSVFRPTDAGELLARYQIDGRKIILGVAGPWKKSKGLDVFLRLAPRLPEDYQIVLVGLSAQQKDALPSNVTGIGRTNSPAELAALYSAAEVFCNPTTADNFPTTQLEALACGTPVVTYNTGGASEALPAACGTVVPAGDEAALLYALLKTKKQDCAAACLKQAAEYEKHAQFRKYLALYERLEEKNSNA